MKLAIVNSDPKEATYGGVSPIMRNMHPRLSAHFDVRYFFLPPSWQRFPGLGRVKVMVYLFTHRRALRQCDFILSHIPEGSYAVSFFGRPYAHIYHGNTNPMQGSKYWFGRYFKRVFEMFFRRIARTAALRYTVGPVFDDVRKLPNPIRHSIKPIPASGRSGFIFAGRLEAGKNIDRIIRIYASLPASVRRTDKLYIAGKGTQEQRLRQLVSGLGLDDSVVFLGALPNSELIAADAYKRILLMASDFEGFPTAIAEALSVGVPVVTTDVGDIPSFVTDGFNGRLLPLGFSDSDYAAAIADILDNYDRFSTAALQSAVAFDGDAITDRLAADITSVLNTSSRP